MLNVSLNTGTFLVKFADQIEINRPNITSFYGNMPHCHYRMTPIFSQNVVI